MSLLDFFVSNAHAAAPDAAPGGGGTGYESIIMLVAMGAIFYFLLIRPQSKRAKSARWPGCFLQSGYHMSAPKAAEFWPKATAL